MDDMKTPYAPYAPAISSSVQQNPIKHQSAEAAEVIFIHNTTSIDEIIDEDEEEFILVKPEPILVKPEPRRDESRNGKLIYLPVRVRITCT